MIDTSEGRFSSLLKPIKDLTKNWNVDIAAHLEDYLEELEHTTVSFDGGVTTMNFAQAAMLVQSTACIYSKKVEYLYSLVYQVLDMLADKKKQSKKSSVDADGNDADADFHDDADDDEFLSLDDIQEGRNLYCKTDFDNKEEFQLLPEMPLCLIPLEEGEKGDNPLVSKKGEVLASRNDFKMNTCCIHSQGTLLLDMSHLKLLQEFIQQALVAAVSSQSEEITVLGGETHGGEGENVQQPMECPEDEIGAMLDMSDGAPPLDDHDDSGDQQQVEGQDECRRSERQREQTAVRQKITKPFVDPWRQLDPHEETKQPKPATRTGKTQKLCAGLEEATRKRKRTKTKTARDKTLTLIKYLETALYSNAHKFPKNALKIPTYVEFEQLYWEEYKRRQALHMASLRQRRERLIVEGDNDVPDDVVDDISPLADVDNDADDYEPLVDDNLLTAIDNALGGEQPYTPGNANTPWADWIDEDIVVNGYEDLVRKHVDEYMASAQEYAQITELSRRVAEWEDKIVPRLEEEERQKVFDINTYGSSILESIFSNKSIKFQSMVRGQSVVDICRTFLASLMLANTTNIRIDEHGVLEEGMDRFELELLSTRRHHQQLEDYTAPSLSQT